MSKQSGPAVLVVLVGLVQRNVEAIIRVVVAAAGCCLRSGAYTRSLFSSQLEPCLTHQNTLHTPNDPFTRGYTTPTRTPYPMNIARDELRSERV
jgi:hypothetical protein